MIYQFADDQTMRAVLVRLLDSDPTNIAEMLDQAVDRLWAIAETGAAHLDYVK